MNIGLTSVTFRGLGAEHIIELARRGGADGIEWGGDVHVPAGDVKTAERVGGLTRAAGLGVLSYGSYLRFPCSAEEAEKTLASAAALNAPRIRVWCGEKGSADTSEEEFAALTASLKAFTKAAGAHGMTVAGEFHNGTANDCAETSIKLISAVDEPNYRTYWQPLCFDARDKEYLAALTGHAAALHVFKWDKNGKRYPLKKGAEEWAGYLALAPQAEDAIIEFVKGDGKRQFLKDIAVLRRIL